MLNEPPHCTNVLLLVLSGHHLLGSKITRPSLKSSSYPYRRQLLFISLIIVIRSDASDHAVGAVLFQIYCDSNRAVHQPIAFASHKFSGAAVNWDTFKQEAYALYYAVVQFNYYLRGKSFVIETDHRNLVWMKSSQVPIVVRWRVFLQSFIFEIRHIPGKNKTVADWISRMYPPSMGLPSLNSLAATDLPNLLEMLHSVYGHRSLHHGAKKTYLAMCTRYPGHDVPIIQDFVAECPLSRKIVYLTQLYRIQLLSIPFYITPVLLALTMSLLHHMMKTATLAYSLLLSTILNILLHTPSVTTPHSSNRPFQALLHIRFLRFYIFRSWQFPNEQCCLGSQHMARYPPSCLSHRPT